MATARLERRAEAMAAGGGQKAADLVRRPDAALPTRRIGDVRRLHRVVGQEATIDGVGASHREHLHTRRRGLALAKPPLTC